MNTSEAKGSKSRTDLSGREPDTEPAPNARSGRHAAKEGTRKTARKSSRRTSTKKRSQQQVLGWREWVTFPDLKPANSLDHPGSEPVRIKAKVDTGARTSTLHAFGLRRVLRDGKAYARFDIHPIQRSAHESVTVELEIHDERPVRSSSGKAQVRPVVIVPVRIGEVDMEIELTLTQRDEMGFRMLLGRQALRTRFLVDPSASYLSEPRTARRRTRRSPAARTETSDPRPRGGETRPDTREPV